MSDNAVMLQPGDYCVVVLDRARFAAFAQWWIDWACISYPHCVTINSRVVQISLGRFIVQDEATVELLREIQQQK